MNSIAKINQMNDIDRFLEINNMEREAKYVFGSYGAFMDMEYDPIADNIELIEHYLLFKHSIKDDLILAASMRPSDEI